MRVLVFSTDDFLFPAGGAEQALGEVTARMPHVEFDLICARLRPKVSTFERVQNVRIYRIGFGIPKLDGVLLFLFGHIVAGRLLRRRQYDLIWSVMASYGAFAAVRVKRKTKLPFLLSLQEGDDLATLERKMFFVRPAFRNIFKEADGLHAISKYLLDWGRRMGFRGEVYTVIPNGVAMRRFTTRPSKAVLSAERAKLTLPEKITILITSSRLVKKNGVEDLIRSLVFLPETTHLIIAGSGILETRLKRLVQQLGLQKRVTFLGFIEHDRLVRFLYLSDIFIRPSLSEGLGNAFLEAMAAGVITVGTAVGGIPDFLTDGVTGFFVKPRNPQDIAAVVAKIRRLSPEERERIQDTARGRVFERYDWNRISEDMERLMKELAKQS